MLGRKERDQLEHFITGSLPQLIPDDYILVRVDRVLDLSWLGSSHGGGLSAHFKVSSPSALEGLELQRW
jgi:hypothetical protein